MQINISFLPALEYLVCAAKVIKTLMCEDDFFEKIIFGQYTKTLISYIRKVGRQFTTNRSLIMLSWRRTAVEHRSPQAAVAHKGQVWWPSWGLTI